MEEFRVVFNNILSVESNSLLLYFTLRLVDKTCATFSTKKQLDQKQLQVGHAHIAVLSASYMWLFQILIGSLSCLHLLWLVRVTALVLVLQHSIENLFKRFDNVIHFLPAWSSQTLEDSKMAPNKILFQFPGCASISAYVKSLSR